MPERNVLPSPARRHPGQPARTLWRSGDDFGPGDVVLAGYAPHWTAQVLRAGTRFRWQVMHQPLTVATILSQLPDQDHGQLTVRQPVPARGVVVVHAAASRGPTAIRAVWHPFPTAEHAHLHERCAVADRGLAGGESTVRRAAAELGVHVPAGWKPVDPGHWLATVPASLIEPALALATQRQVPVAVAGEALATAGFARLDQVGAEIVAGLVPGWDRPLAELIDAARLLA
jgi:hypothetical protein